MFNIIQHKQNIYNYFIILIFKVFTSTSNSKPLRVREIQRERGTEKSLFSLHFGKDNSGKFEKLIKL